MRIGIKILGSRTPHRYTDRRAVVVAAQAALGLQYPDLLVDVTELKDLDDIEKVTPVFIYPNLLVINKQVCVGRFPKAGEILIWLQQALSP
jgi:hypothetical protein